MQQPYNTDPREQPNYTSSTDYAPPDPQGAFGPTSAYMQPANGAPVPYPVPYAVPVPVPATTEPGRTQALTSVVLGAVGLVNIVLILGFGICGVPIGLGLSTLGVVFGVLGLRSPSRKQMAVVGLVLAGIPVVVMIALALYSIFAPPPSF